jgi:hypothetical protein
VSKTGVYVAPDVAAVRALWDRSGAQAGPATDAQLSAFADAVRAADAAGERAVDAVVLGRTGELERLLAETPDLIARRSAYGHRATLLHYTAANGVEIRRQVVPANAAEITARLLAAGADATATLHAYGERPDTLAMLRSSAHPQAAGVAEEIERVLATPS